MQPISKEVCALALSKHILLSSVNITEVEEGMKTREKGFLSFSSLHCSVYRQCL